MADTDTRAFEIVLKKSGRRLHVPADRSILEVLIEADVPMACVCRDGICGTCETGVVEGDVDHRDDVLTDEEKAASATMMVCVSRARTGDLVLDL